MGLTLKKNFGFALVGNLGYAASQYIILLVFIKLFSTEEVGQFVFASAFTTPLMLALEMQLRNFYITDRKENLSFKDYTAFRVLTTFVGVVGLTLSAYILKPEFFSVVLIVTLIKCFESQLDLLYGVYQKNHQLDYVAYSRIIRGVVAIFTVVSLSFFLKNIIISLLGYLISWIVLYFFYERKQVIKRGFLTKGDLKLVLLSKDKMKYLLSICLPIFFAIFIDKYYLNYPRLSVEKFFGIQVLAIFGSLLYFKSLGSQFVTSLIQAAIPKLSDFVSENNFKALNAMLIKMITIACGFGLSLTLFFYLFGDYVLEILYTKEYAVYNDVLVMILLGATIAFTYLYLGSTLTCIRKQWVRLPISIISFVLLYIFINFFELKELLDIAFIVFYVELCTLVMYIIVYFYFIFKLKKSVDR